MPVWSRTTTEVQRVSVLLTNRFSNLCLANAVEPLRAANMISEREHYQWQFLTLNGTQVTSSSGMIVKPDAALESLLQGDILFVIAGYDFQLHASHAFVSALRAAASRHRLIVGLDTGSWLMAEAGLLDGHPSTIHSDSFDLYAEKFPETLAKRERFIIGSELITAGGGTATLDLILELIARQHGEALRMDVSALFMHETDEANTVKSTPKARTRTVARALSIMRDYIETPLPIPEIAKRVGRTQSDLAARFLRDLGATPTKVYQHLRLYNAKQLVIETELPIAEIAVRCGYINPSAMTRAFRLEFGASPRALRQRI